MSESWRCFHCDEVFTDRRKAWEHFGEMNCASDVPACIDPLRHDEKARIKELREAHEHASKCQAEAEENDGAAEQVETMYSELRRYFGEDCNSVWLAGDRYKSALNILGDLREQIATAERRGRLEFSRRNRTRCEHPKGFNHLLSSWSTSDWFLAVIGELGEAANIAKKLNRVRDGIPGNKETVQELNDKLRKELGDTQVYLDLLAQSLGFYIQDAAFEVFESKSHELGYNDSTLIQTLWEAAGPEGRK